MPLPTAALISAASQVFSVGSSSFASSCIAALVHGPPGCGKALSRSLATNSTHHLLSGKSTLVANVAQQLGVALRRIDCFSFASDIPVMHFHTHFAFCLITSYSHSFPPISSWRLTLQPLFSSTRSNPYQGDSEMRVMPSRLSHSSFPLTLDRFVQHSLSLLLQPP